MAKLLVVPVMFVASQSTCGLKLSVEQHSRDCSQARLEPEASFTVDQSRSEKMAAPQKGDLSASERKILQVIAAGE